MANFGVVIILYDSKLFYSYILSQCQLHFAGTVASSVPCFLSAIKSNLPHMQDIYCQVHAYLHSRNENAAASCSLMLAMPMITIQTCILPYTYCILLEVPQGFFPHTAV